MLTTNEAIQDFQELIQPFGYSDLEQALEQLQVIKGKNTEQFEEHFSNCMISEALLEILNDAKESYGYETINDLDPVYEVMNHILQMARNFISEKINYDFQNDLSTETVEIYTAGNYMASTYDYSEEAIEELREKIEESKYTVKELVDEDIFFAYLAEEINL